MKLEMKQKLAKVFKDLNAIDNVNDLKKRKLTLNEYYTCQKVFNDLNTYGKSETFIKNVADYFKRFGFIVRESGINFIII